MMIYDRQIIFKLRIHKMNDLETLFDQQQLNHIDEIITGQMNVYFEDRIECALQKQLMKMVHNFKKEGAFPSLSAQYVSLPSELNIFAIISQLGEEYSCQIAGLKNKICQLNCSNQTLKEQIAMKQAQNVSCHRDLQNLTLLYVKSDKENIDHRQEIYLLKSYILMQREDIESSLSELASLKNLNAQKEEQHIQQTKSYNENLKELKEVIACLQLKNLAMEQQLKDIEDQLVNEVERRKSMLITMEIEAGQIQEKAQDIFGFWKKMNLIHQQNRNLVDLLADLKNNLISCSLQEIQNSITAFDVSRQQVDDYFNEFFSYSSSIEKTADICTAQMAKLNSQIKDKRQYIKQLEIERNRMQKQRENLINEQIKGKNLNQNLMQKVSQLTESNYRTLIELTESKGKIEKCLESQRINSKQLKKKLHQIRQEIEKKQELLKKYEQQLSSLRELNQKLSTESKIKQQERNQFENSYIALKNNLKQLVVIKEGEEQGERIEKFINKEVQSFEKQMQQRMKIKALQQEIKLILERQEKLKEEKANIQEEYHEILQDYKQLSQRTLIFQSLLKEQQNSASVNTILLEQKDSQINQLKKCLQKCEEQINLNKKQKTSKETQVQLPLRQTQIKKQSINTQSLTTSIQKSNIFKSQYESKENKPEKSNIKSTISKQKQSIGNKISSTLQEQMYKQKIAALNEIINFIINYIKGYHGNNIREHSWFTHQINKYGQTYETKLRSQNHMASKIKTQKFIEELCEREPACKKLLEQFKGIMKYYFNQAEASTALESLNETIPKSMLDRTMGKQGVSSRVKNTLNKYCR